jgi:uncharacterized RDD family membrane protein YckC
VLSGIKRPERIIELSPGYDVLDYSLTVWIWSEIIVLLFNRRKRALHDFIAGTVVIHTSSTMNSREDR